MRERAFTLIELLAVIAIIGILCALTFGAIRGVQQRAAISQAKAELAVLAQALEAYKQQYGDYPASAGTNNPTATSLTLTTSDGPAILFNALVGNIGPSGSAISGGGHVFVEASKFSLLSSTAGTVPTASTGGTPLVNGFVDPWGNLYLYYYKTSNWKSPSYVLLSVGPNYIAGKYVAPTTGITGDAYLSAAGNKACIYATQNSSSQ